MGQYSPLSRANLEEKLKMEYVSVQNISQKVQTSLSCIYFSCSGLTVELLLFTAFINSCTEFKFLEGNLDCCNIYLFFSDIAHKGYA